MKKLKDVWKELEDSYTLQKTYEAFTHLQTNVDQQDIMQLVKDAQCCFEELQDQELEDFLNLKK